MTCICVDVDCHADASWNKLAKARKQHRCGECRRTIEPGETYEYVRGVWEGSFRVYKTCHECWEIRGALFQCGWYYEDIWQEIDDWMDDVPLSALDQMGPAAREKLCRHFEIWG